MEWRRPPLHRRKIVDLPSLSGLSHRMPANSFRVRQLIAELLHLLSRLDTGHLRDVIVIQTLGMIRYQVENLFLVRHVRNIPSKDKIKELFLLFYNIIV